MFLLAFVFIWAIIKCSLLMAFVTAPFFIFFGLDEKWNLSKQPALKHDVDSYKFLLLCGLGFLILSFILRTQTQYDLFDRRTIGFGVIFIFVGILGLKIKNIDQLSLRKTLISIVLLVATSFILSISITGWGYVFQIPYITPSNLIENNRSTAMNQAVVPFMTPSPSFFISGGRGYYHYGAQIISVATAPYSKPDDFDSFIKKLERASKDCVLDFSNIHDLDGLEKMLSAMYPVDVKFALNYMPFEKVYITQYNPELKSF